MELVEQAQVPVVPLAVLEAQAGQTLARWPLAMLRFSFRALPYKALTFAYSTALALTAAVEAEAAATTAATLVALVVLAAALAPMPERWPCSLAPWRAQALSRPLAAMAATVPMVAQAAAAMRAAAVEEEAEQAATVA